MPKSLKMMALAHAHRLGTLTKPALTCKAEETGSLKSMHTKKVKLMWITMKHRCYLEETGTDVVATTEQQLNRPRINQIHKKLTLQSGMILLILLPKSSLVMRLLLILKQAI